MRRVIIGPRRTIASAAAAEIGEFNELHGDVFCLEAGYGCNLSIFIAFKTQQ
ncbi:hypothetical protein [Collimonas fungivorans]